jgi:integration host factor subunit beta|tara:strand:+ start:4487 stop:4774 length:288 start_codon:yes stop_codon:yes gene_type:complete
LLKSKIIKKLNKKHPNFSPSQISSLVNLAFDTITNSLLKDKSVELRDIGRWSIKKIRAKYNARNPKTGEIIYIPEKKKISFKMSKKLKNEINNSK